MRLFGGPRPTRWSSRSTPRRRPSAARWCCTSVPDEITETGRVRQLGVERSVVVGEKLYTYSAFGLVSTEPGRRTGPDLLFFFPPPWMPSGNDERPASERAGVERGVPSATRSSGYSSTSTFTRPPAASVITWRASSIDEPCTVVIVASRGSPPNHGRGARRRPTRRGRTPRRAAVPAEPGGDRGVGADDVDHRVDTALRTSGERGEGLAELPPRTAVHHGVGPELGGDRPAGRVDVDGHDPGRRGRLQDLDGEPPQPADSR